MRRRERRFRCEKLDEDRVVCILEEIDEKGEPIKTIAKFTGRVVVTPDGEQRLDIEEREVVAGSEKDLEELIKTFDKLVKMSTAIKPPIVIEHESARGEKLRHKHTRST